jgi:hypothetical protein
VALEELGMGESAGETEDAGSSGVSILADVPMEDGEKAKHDMIIQWGSSLNLRCSDVQG